MHRAGKATLRPLRQPAAAVWWRARRQSVQPAAWLGGGRGRWGNRLSPGSGTSSSTTTSSGSSGDSKWLSDLEASSLHSLDTAPNGPDGPPPSVPAWRQQLSSKLGRLQYHYFNWRQDTWSDLQLFLTINAAVFLGGAAIEVR